MIASPVPTRLRSMLILGLAALTLTIFALTVLPLTGAARTGAGAKDGISFKIDTWRDRSIDFTSLHVFTLAPVPPGTANRIARGIRTREDDIRAYLIAAFEERGYSRDPDADLDFTLHFIFTPPERQQPSRTSRRIGQVLGSVEIETGGDTFNHLYVELRHPETDMPIWRGRANRVLKRKSKDETPRLQAACQAIAAAFPAAANALPSDAEKIHNNPWLTHRRYATIPQPRAMRSGPSRAKIPKSRTGKGMQDLSPSATENVQIAREKLEHTNGIIDPEGVKTHSPGLTGEERSDET